MKNEEERCIVTTSFGEIPGTIIKKYEEIGGPEDGAQFQVIKLDNGQVITVKIENE